MELTVKQGRREFFRSAGIAGLGAASALAVLKIGEGNAQAQQTQPGFHRDTPAQLFTAALIAEDLATTFYYNALVGKVIQDPALAGPGGTALNPGSSGDANNVSYVRAALGQEFAHAGLLRSLLKIDNDDVRGFSHALDSIQALSKILQASYQINPYACANAPRLG